MIITDNRRLPKLALTIIAVLGWALILYLAWNIGYSSWRRSMFAAYELTKGLPEIDPFNDRYTAHPWVTLLHTVPGVLFALLGPLQFMSPIRRRWPALHRATGRVFLPIALLCGLIAVVMGFAFPVWGNTINQPIVLLWGLFMLYAFTQAYRHIRARRIAAHREWMIRGFAAGLAVSRFRVMLYHILPVFGLGFDDAWNVVVIVSAPMALGAAEFWIWATRPRAGRREPGGDASPAVS